MADARRLALAEQRERLGDGYPFTLKRVLFEINMENSVYSTPVAAGGVLYINGRTHLYAISTLE